MTCSLLKIPSLSSEQVDTAYICEPRKMVAVATPDLKLKVYSFANWASEPESVREFKSHTGAILGMAFAPLAHHAYLLSFGYDKTLNLFNLDDHKSTEPAFTFTQDDQHVGYFTCAAFIPLDKSRLVFAAGTSTGHVTVFDSHFNFEPKTHHLFNGAVKAITGSHSGELAVAAAGFVPKLILDFDFANAQEFAENGQALTKTNHLKFSSGFSQSDQVWLLSACEDQTVGIWELDESLRMLKHIQNVELHSNVLGLNWNIGCLSATLFCGKKEDKLGEMKAFKLTAAGSEEENQWKAYGLEIKSE